MKKQKSWIEKTVIEAANCNTRMPWERGAQRQALIASRMERESREIKITLPALPANISLSARG